MKVGPLVIWEPAGVSVEVASAVPAVVVSSFRPGNTPLGISERTSVGIREVKSSGIPVRCACAVAPAAMATLSNVNLMIRISFENHLDESLLRNVRNRGLRNNVYQASQLNFESSENWERLPRVDRNRHCTHGNTP
jgi:hypothetical protein